MTKLAGRLNPVPSADQFKTKAVETLPQSYEELVAVQAVASAPAKRRYKKRPKHAICEVCGFEAKSKAGLGLHTRRAHPLKPELTPFVESSPRPENTNLTMGIDSAIVVGTAKEYVWQTGKASQELRDFVAWVQGRES